MKNRGMSGIMTALIMVLLVLVAIGIVWQVVLPMIEKGTESASDKFDALLDCDENKGTDKCETNEICMDLDLDEPKAFVSSLDTTRCCVGDCIDCLEEGEVCDPNLSDDSCCSSLSCDSASKKCTG